MEKRKKFVFASLFLGGAYLVDRLVLTDLIGYYGDLGFLFLTAFLVIFFLFARQLGSFKKLITIAILPCFFVLTVLLFLPLLPASFFWEIFLFALIVLGFYVTILVENVFVVLLSFKAVPLYRAASVTGFLVLLLVSYFIFNTIFSLKFPPWINGLLVFAGAMPVFYHLFWSTAIAESGKKSIGVYTMISCLLVAQLAVAISFWPAEIGLSSLYLVSLVYSLGGIIQAQIKGRLFKRTLFEYIGIGLGTFIALFFSVNFR